MPMKASAVESLYKSGHCVKRIPLYGGHYFLEQNGLQVKLSQEDLYKADTDTFFAPMVSALERFYCNYTRGKALKKIKKKNQKNQLKSLRKNQKSKKSRTPFFKCFTLRSYF